MATRLSAQRYAQAIFELAVAHQQTEQWDSDLRLAADVLGDDDFAAFLKHAEVPAERKVAAVNAVLSETHPLVCNLVSLMVSRGGVDAMPAVQESYTRLLDEHLGRRRALVTTAVPPDDDELARITDFVARLAGSAVIVAVQVDESILGGLIVQIGDRLLDGSSATALARMRQSVRAPAA